ncbi:isotrichodermin C-15 hydroxylase [Xylogone sp. PMI_703]|nr:isotrichodermin C-15 hydroxylase [Xylogone sp. PMI_703]
MLGVVENFLLATSPVCQIFIGIILSAIIYGAYQIYFHPLAKYPGPPAAKFTNLREIYYAWNGDQHLDIQRCHEKYGPIVRYGPNHLLFNTATGIKDIYILGKNISKHPAFEGRNEKFASIGTIHDKVEHAKRRRIVSPGFTAIAIKRFEPKLLDHVNKFCNLVYQIGESEWSAPVNMSEWINWLTFDIISDLLFDTNFNLLEKTTYRHITSDIEEANIRLNVLIYAPLLVLGRLDKLLFKKSVKGSHNLLSFTKIIIKEHLEKSCPGESILSYLTASAQKLSSTALLAEAHTLLMAGYETSAVALCAIIFYISRNQKVQDKLAKEVRSTFTRQDEIEIGDKLRHCEYLNACISEALRMTPPLGGCPWRQVGKSGHIIDGHFIPSGYSVGTGIYSIHHNPAYFSQPHEYKPERWLEGPKLGKEQSTAPEGYIPFSLGTRSCLGKTFANAQISIIIAFLVWAFDIRVAEGPEGELGCGGPHLRYGRTNTNEFQLQDHLVGAKEGPVVQLRPIQRQS